MRRGFVVLLILALASPAWAGSYDVFGTGARAIALGGAYTALGDDLAGLYYNLAAITQSEKLLLEIGYSYADPRLVINGREQDLDPHRGLTLGGIVSTVAWDHRISLGLSVFMPDDHFLRFLVLSTNQPHSALAHNANHAFTLLAGLAGEVLPRRLSLGVGVNVLATERGGVDFTINEDEPSEGSVFSELSPAYAVMAGIWGKPLDWMQAGFAFRDKIEMSFALPNRIKIPPLTIFTKNQFALIRESELSLIAESNSHFSPRSYELGLSFEPLRELLLSTNLAYAEWSDMQTDAPYASAYVTGGLADVFPTEPGKHPKAPDFRDTLSVALGVEGRPVLQDHVRLALRAGYRYRPTPVPEQKYENNYLDADAHIMAAGFGLAGDRLAEWLPRSLSLDGFVQYQYSPERTYHKATAYDLIGDLTFQQTWLSGGGTLTVRF